ncbi:MAG: EAL domain-containing protein [Burkholderiaceae bacterium]|nr:EAL domain-containing protein [Burkholderiaceae bacterium]
MNDSLSSSVLLSEIDGAPHRTLQELQALLDNAGAGIVFIRERQVVRCNARFAQLFGYGSAAELIGQRSESFSLGRTAYRDLGRAAFPVIAEGKPYTTEREMRRRDGRRFWARLTGSLINTAEPLDGAVWVIDDLDAQKTAQKQLEAALWEKQTLFDHAMVGIVYLVDRQMTRCNSFFESMLGYGPGELTGCSTRLWYASDAEWDDISQRSQPVLQRGDSFAGEVSICRKDGSQIVCEVRSRALHPGKPEQGSLWTVMDVTERRNAQAAVAQAQVRLERLVQERTRQLSETVDSLHREMEERQVDRDRIHWLAHYDALTGLPNRTLLAERSRDAIAAAQQGGTPLAVVFLDLDHFKHVNDSLGHRVGDALLVAIAERLRAVVRDKDTVCRLGGDEFILLLPGANAHGAERVAGKLLEASKPPYQIGHHELTMAPSMGIAMFPGDGADFDTLTQSADVAMYRAKQGGRNTYRFFTPEMQAQSARALTLENALRRALEREQFTLHYQPQVCLASGRLRGVEALLRWQHPELGAISPAEFIPLAEDSGQILAIGDWVLRTALAQLNTWQRASHAVPGVAVNLSAVQFRQPGMPERIRQMLAEAKLPAQVLELELTEGVALDDPQAASATMDQLNALGVRLAIDDFGTGYSSLSYLQRCSYDTLKIDRSFVHNMGIEDDSTAIIKTIVGLGRMLNMNVVAEGVESQSQFDALVSMDCPEAQGFWFSEPVPPNEAGELIRQSRVEH